MRVPVQLAIIFGICLVGEILHQVVGIPIPGNILGMVILLLLLCSKIITPEQISGVAGFFLNHLALFFLPPSIAIMSAGDEILNQWPSLLILCVVLTLAVIISTGLTTQLFIHLQEHRDNLKRRQGK
ncbi:MAG: CidA/LrgA family protein [Fibrobacter sp.]|nr:CidA/LrgA family protein [Fibrobacter sp.]